MLPILNQCFGLEVSLDLFLSGMTISVVGTLEDSANNVVPGQLHRNSIEIV